MWASPMSSTNVTNAASQASATRRALVRFHIAAPNSAPANPQGSSRISYSAGEQRQVEIAADQQRHELHFENAVLHGPGAMSSG